MLLVLSCIWQLSFFIFDGVLFLFGDLVLLVDMYVGGWFVDQLCEWVEKCVVVLGILVIVLEVYVYVVCVVEVENFKCYFVWIMLVGIGWVESYYGIYWGVMIVFNGDVSFLIWGVCFDGIGGILCIVDRDGGGLDGDVVVECVVGLMQFILEIWWLYGVVVRNDGIVNVDNIDDVVFLVVGYLCWCGKDFVIL